MDTNVLINLRRRCQIKQRIPKAIYSSKELREQAVKLVTDEGLGLQEAAKRLSLQSQARIGRSQNGARSVKKSGGVLCEGNAVKYAMMKTLREDYPMPVMCRIYGVSTSGYYAWLSRSPSKRAREDARLELEIRAAHQRARETFGPERLKDNLGKNGIDTTTYKVKSLRSKMGIRCKQIKKFKATTNSNHEMPVAPNLLEQKFTASAPNQVWLADITYIQTDEGWLYLAGHKDIFTGDLVGYAMGERMTKNLVSQSLFRAVAEKRLPRGSIHHSDRGSQYCAHEFARPVRHGGIHVAAGELLRQRADGELLGIAQKRAGPPLQVQNSRRGHRSYHGIHRFYRRQRTQARLGYLSPAAFERQYYENMLAA